MASAPFYALVAGVGPGAGRSIALRFAQTYPTVLLARRRETLNDIVRDIEGQGGKAIAVAADVSDPAALEEAFATIKRELPESQLAAAVFNVNTGFVKKPFLEMALAELQTGVSITTTFFNFAQNTLPLLSEAAPTSPHPPSLIVTGATASLKASAEFASFAAGKFALRAMTQSLAREFGPRGVHVSHVIMDGLIDTPVVRQRMGAGEPDGRIDPDAIAETYWNLHTQPRSAFTHEIDIRPFSGTF